MLIPNPLIEALKSAKRIVVFTGGQHYVRHGMNGKASQGSHGVTIRGVIAIESGPRES
jgi:hypothetical protein